jgi:hypothetical protein
MPIAAAPHDPGPVPRRRGAVPAPGLGGFDRRVRGLGWGPHPLLRLERQHVGPVRAVERCHEPRVVAIETVGHDRTKGDSRGHGGVHQRLRYLRLGAKRRIRLAPGEPTRRGIRLPMQRLVHPLVGPERGHGAQPVVDLADGAELLAGHLGGLRAGLAIPGIIEHQPALRMGAGRRCGEGPR